MSAPWQAIRFPFGKWKIPGGMSGGFRIEDHTADLALRVWARTLPGLFEEAAHAMVSRMVSGLLETEPPWKKRIHLEAPSLEALFFSWLKEILFLIENENVCYMRFHIEKHNFDERNASTYVIEALLEGIPLDQLGHDLCREIKAVTHHGFYLKRRGPWWETRILFDL